MANENGASNENSSYVVGIGASAGGLEAIQSLLAALPCNTGFPFIIVQHLSPDYKSLLCEILTRSTAMSVIEAEDNMPVLPDHVYVIQPGKNMRISDGRLVLQDQPSNELNLPINMFFRSLAEEAGPHAIGIVLSGTGSDGANGLRAIKERDGLTLVQNLDTAQFDGMPRNAISTGIVDAQLTPEMIAAEVAHIAAARKERSVANPEEKELQISEEQIIKIFSLMEKTSDINFSHYKRSTISRRIERRMMLKRRDTVSDYIELLAGSEEEAKALSKELLIGVTRFFRDPENFLALKEKAIQSIVINSNPRETIRVWVAGCSTGEEAYSVAILFCEVMESLKLQRSVMIFATDLDADAVEIAGKGVYTGNITDSISSVRLSKYFTPSGGNYVVKRELRKMVIFSVHNVFQDPPFGRLDLISCRNMMIYFQPILQNDLFSIFHSALKDKGYLFLGKAEAVGAYTEAFPPVDAAAKLFTHNVSVKYAGEKTIPFLQAGHIHSLYEKLSPEPEPISAAAIEAAAIHEKKLSIDNKILEQFLPACLVINSENHIVHSYGDCSNCVHISLGEFSSDLYSVLAEGLKIPVSTVLQQAREQKKSVQYTDLCFSGEKREETVSLTATPVGKGYLDGENLFALVFQTNSPENISKDAKPFNVDEDTAMRIFDLEQELELTKSRLKKSVTEHNDIRQELQSTNDKLIASNEALLTSNEELQSSNEELQSVNEELYTVNADFQHKVTELSALNDDLANFLASTFIGIIFLDRILNIRRFTDYVSAEFSIMPRDVGRPITFMAFHFPAIDLTAICAKVMKTLIADDREVTSNKGKIYLMRVAPYRSTERNVLGCVITLVDITEQKRGMAKLHEIETHLDKARSTTAAKTERIGMITSEFSAALDKIAEKTDEAEKQSGGSAAGEIRDTVEHLRSLLGALADTVAEKDET